MVVWEKYVDYNQIFFEPEKRRQGQRSQKTYASKIAAFDIETSRFPDIDQSIMYIWQFSLENEIVILGRTWEEFTHLITSLKERLDGLYLLCFVHNLSFEGQFLSGIYDFSNDEVFATESRHILKMDMFSCIEFRCSYRLFNMSLKAVTAKYNCEHSKLSGDSFNYNKIRTSGTALNKKELLYCVYDVMGLIEALRAQIELYGDNLYSLPFTQTGYIRREARKSMSGNRGEVYNCIPPYECYRVLRAAFRGGNTHASRFYVNDIIENVHGCDVSSEYPAQQVLEKYPRSPFKQAGSLSLRWDFVHSLIDRDNAVLMVVEFFNIRTKDMFCAFPYISSSKAIGRSWGGMEDNGRILKAEYIRLAITDIDFKIIEKQYTWNKSNILDIWSAKYGPMYDGIINLNKKLFLEKTQLKNIKGQELYYAKAKEQLNSLYGMTVQNPLTRDLLFSTPKGRYVYSELKSDETIYKEIKPKLFLPYQLGVWTTAHARAELQKFIDRAGDNAIYCDTDSLMYIGDISFSDFNNEYKRRCEESGEGAYAVDKNGGIHYMGVFESEDDKKAGYKYRRFITQGAKRYAFEKPSGEIGITVAGVSKINGAKELAEKGGLNSFRPGLIFENSGKLESVYRDENYGDYEYDGATYNITANVTLRPTTYELSHSKDYASLLRNTRRSDLLEALRDLKIHNLK